MKLEKISHLSHFSLVKFFAQSTAFTTFNRAHLCEVQYRALTRDLRCFWNTDRIMEAFKKVYIKSSIE